MYDLEMRCVISIKEITNSTPHRRQLCRTEAKTECVRASFGKKYAVFLFYYMSFVIDNTFANIIQYLHYSEEQNCTDQKKIHQFLKQE